MKIARRLILSLAAMFCAVPAALGNHYILPCDDDCRDAGAVIGPGTTGAWGVPGQGTYDFMLEVLPGQPAVLSVAWLAFAPEGGPMWIVARGPASGNHATLTAYRAAPGGGQFAATANPANAQIALWGTLTLIFDGCDSGVVAWAPADPSYPAGATDIARRTLPAGLACTPSATIRSPPGDTPDATVQAAPGDMPDVDPLSDPGYPEQP